MVDKTTIENGNVVTNTIDIKENQYPKPTGDGFAYQDATDEAMKLESKEGEDYDEIRVTLKKGQQLVVRELIGTELEQAVKIAQQKRGEAPTEEASVAAVIHLSTLYVADGNKIPLDAISRMRSKDYLALKTAVTRLNFM